jgi:TetR/AcrR family transcriptional regulator, regulator of autoinduction and epiphytic fitness
MGQQQGAIRPDEDPNFLALVLLGIYGQAMLTALSTGVLGEDEIRRLIRIVDEGIGATTER